MMTGASIKKSHDILLNLRFLALNSRHDLALMLCGAEFEVPDTLPRSSSLCLVSTNQQIALMTYQSAILDGNGDTGTNESRLDVSLRQLELVRT